MGEVFKHRPPAFQFYVDDWLGSNTVAECTLSEQGAYIRLLCRCWATDDCALPNDDAILARYAGMRLDRWRKSKVLLLQTWDIKGSQITHPKLIAQRRDRDNLIEQRRLAGKASAKARNTRSTPVQQPRNTSDFSLQTTNNKPTARLARAEVDDAFQELWKHWKSLGGKGRAKPKALAEFKTALKAQDDPPLEFARMLGRAMTRQAKHRESLERMGKFAESWPWPARWIKEQRWLDELEPLPKPRDDGPRMDYPNGLPKRRTGSTPDGPEALDVRKYQKLS